MKKILLTAVMAISMCLLCIGAASAQSADDKRGPGPEMRGDRARPEEAASLTEAQKATVKSILSKYNASSLTAADAKVIHKAFRDAGIRKGPGLRGAVQEAGFDPEKLRELDPPPDMQGPENRPSGPNESSRQGGGPGRKQER